jgi:hypothetical protein
MNGEGKQRAAINCKITVIIINLGDNGIYSSFQLLFSNLQHSNSGS